MLLNKEEMLDRLLENVVTVNFTKNNGDKRTMNCTLRASEMPTLEYTHYIDSDSNIDNGDLVTAWDVDKQAWRSFHLSAVNYILNPVE